MITEEWQEGFSFKIITQDTHSHARVGMISTPHGEIATPAFMPVGTYGAVKGVSPAELRRSGAGIVLANALHLEFRPGSVSVEKLGGLHALMSWSGPILTDSGGFQTYSLAAFSKRRSDGIEMSSPVDGSRHHLTPESVVQIQRRLGSDFMMPLDLCLPGDSDQKSLARALQITEEWAKRSQQAYHESQPVHGSPQALFGIAQGGTNESLRREAVDQLLEIGFFGYALGGLAVGETAENRWRTVDLCDQLLPQERPRYLMGVGTPQDLLQAIQLGMDLFDCVLPTRNGRKGSVYTAQGKLNLRNAGFREDRAPIENGCTCEACRPRENGIPTFSRGAIRHLLACRDPLGARLGALHNLTFYQRLLTQIRDRIRQNNTAQVKAPVV